MGEIATIFLAVLVVHYLASRSLGPFDSDVIQIP